MKKRIKKKIKKLKKSINKINKVRVQKGRKAMLQETWATVTARSDALRNSPLHL